MYGLVEINKRRKIIYSF